ncbi:hypothetical protein G9A89_003326 [Geosiphon pyriformis]|nr:hypothetical protein G9A89_003326 [Geosiphon pyriformis]
MTLNAPPSLSLTPTNAVHFLSQETTTLIVKNLPDFPETDLIDFLKCFGPQNLRLLNSQQLKNVAFLDFPDRISASAACSKIQGLGKIGGKTVRVEYALPSKEALRKGKEKTTTEGSESSKAEGKPTNSPPPPPPIPPLPSEIGEPISSALGINYPAPPTLHYRYPAPTVEILFNIMNAIAAVPNLYVQVLHLMNKMNLPPPFTAVLPESIPPLLQEQYSEVQGGNKKRKKKDVLLSSGESEIDSEEEEQEKNRKQGSKKRIRTITDLATKMRIPTTSSSIIGSGAIHSHYPSQVTPQHHIPSPIPINPGSLSSSTQLDQDFISQPPLQTPSMPIPIQSKPPHFTEYSNSSSSSVKNKKVSKQSELLPLIADTSTDINFVLESISTQQLNDNKMPEKELKNITAMKKYTRGEPTATLYIKNLQQKKVEVNDLKHIFGRYFRSREEMESQLEIQLMKEGRMRGQAFVKFPDVNIAKQALDEVHGYILHEKPMIIQFSRGP